MTAIERQKLRLGFIGLGKYGYAFLRAIMRTGHHNPDDISYEKFNVSAFDDNQSKRQEVENNYNALSVLFENASNETARERSVEDLIKWAAGEEESQGVLILSLNRETGLRILEENKRHFSEAKGTLWLFSSISQLTVSEIRKSIGLDSGDARLHVVRYLENMGTRKGQGIVAAYVGPDSKAESERVLRRVFFGLGKILILNNESDIDAARIIAGSTIGIIAYFADALAMAIQAQNIQGLGADAKQAADIVYSSMAGALAMARNREVTDWREVLEQIAVLPGNSGKPGTTDALIRKTNEILSEDAGCEDVNYLIRKAYSHVLETYCGGQGDKYER